MEPNTRVEQLSIEQFYQLASSRRSIRRYADGQIEHDVLERLLETAGWAPSAHNRQPWRFCVVTDPSTKETLAMRMGRRWAHDLGQDGAPDTEIARRVSNSRSRMTRAAALILVCLSMEDMDTYADVERQAAERIMATQSVALAAQNLLLAAHANGLGACWMCAPLFAQELVRQVLELPERWEPQALITIGFPAEERTSQREPLRNRVMWR